MGIRAGKRIANISRRYMYSAGDYLVKAPAVSKS